MNTKHLGCCALLGAAMVSCSDEAMLSNEATKPVSTTDGINFVAAEFIDENGTRATYDMSTGAVAFDENDVIGVWGMRDGQLEQVSFRLSEGATEGQAAHFDGGLWRLREGDGTTYAAFYPWSNNIINDWYNGDRQYRVLDYNNQYARGTDEDQSHLSSFDYMYCGPQEVVDGSATFDMQHIGAIVRISMDGLDPNMFIENARISGPDQKFFGWLFYYFDTQSIEKSVNGVFPSSSIDLMCNLFSDAEGHAEFYMMMPPMDLADEELTIAITTPGDELSSTIPGKKIESGHRYVLEASSFVSNKTPLTVGEQTVFYGQPYGFTPDASGFWRFRLNGSDDPSVQISPEAYNYGNLYYLKEGVSYSMKVNTGGYENLMEVEYLDNSEFTKVEFNTPTEVRAWGLVTVEFTEPGFYSLQGSEGAEFKYFFPSEDNYTSDKMLYLPQAINVEQAGTAYLIANWGPHILTVSTQDIAGVLTANEETNVTFSNDDNSYYYQIDIAEDGYYKLSDIGSYYSFRADEAFLAISNDFLEYLKKGSYIGRFFSRGDVLTSADIKLIKAEIVDLPEEGVASPSADCLYRYEFASAGIYRTSANVRTYAEKNDYVSSLSYHGWSSFTHNYYETTSTGVMLFHSFNGDALKVEKQEVVPADLMAEDGFEAEQGMLYSVSLPTMGVYKFEVLSGDATNCWVYDAEVLFCRNMNTVNPEYFMPRDYKFFLEDASATVRFVYVGEE